MKLHDRSGADLNTNEVGQRGEELACLYFRRLGMKVLYRNFDPPRAGEVDVIYRDKDTLVFGEVKTRTSDDYGRPGDAVDKEKQERVAKGGLAWIRMLDNPVALFRFDVIEVVLLEGQKPRIELSKEAFYLPEGYTVPE